MNRCSRFAPHIATILLGLWIIPFAHSGDRPLSLWYFENVDAQIYLLGSMHAMKPDMYPLAEPFLNAFAKAEKVVFEVDLTKLDAYETSLVMQQQGMYISPDSIEHDLHPKTLALLKEYLADVGMVMDQVKQMKPWYLTLTIGQTELGRLGYDPDYGIDQYFQGRASDEGKQILQLESFREQIEILSSDRMFIQDLSLRASLEELSSAEEDLELLVEAWRLGAADKMLELTLISVTRYPELSEQLDNLIFERNARMAHKIREYAETSGTYLVVVGALHMGGENGLIQLLGNEFNVKQLSY